YLLAVRSFLNQVPARSVGPSPLPREADAQAVAGNEEPRRRGKTVLGGGIMVALGGGALSLLILNLPYGILFLPAVFIPVAWWGLSRTQLPASLVPPLGISLGPWLWVFFFL